MNEHDFDALLESSASELPPDDVAHDVTPWRRAMNRILTGFALGAVTVSIRMGLGGFQNVSSSAAACSASSCIRWVGEENRRWRERS